MVKDLVIKCRGLPYSCDESSLRKFLGDSGISKVNIIMRDGKAAGDAFVHYSNEDDYKRALKKDREHMGHRYIEVMPADQDSSSGGGGGRGGGRDRDRSSFRDRRDRDFDYGRPSRMNMMMPAPYGEGVVRLRGLPYGARERDIYDFFAPLNIVTEGILLPDDRTAAKTNGEAYVVFVDQDTADRALMRHMKNMQHRYIEVFAASYGEMVQFCDEFRLRVPRGVAGGGGFGGMARGGFEDSYGGGFGAFGRPGGGDRPAAVAPWDDTRAGFAGSPMADPYAGYGSSSWAGADRRPPSPRGSFGDPYSRVSHGDPYGRSVGAADPYGRPAQAEDPYLRGSRRPEDLFARRIDPYEIGRGASDSWRDDRAPGGPAAYGDSWQEYGYGGSGAGGPIRVREHWRDREDSRGSAAAPPRGRERPGQRYTLKMRGVPFRAIEADIYDFFNPIRPAHVEIIHEASGRPSGEARVEFSSRKDYDDALLKDKQYMGPRYVELFPDFGSNLKLFYLTENDDMHFFGKSMWINCFKHRFLGISTIGAGRRGGYVPGRDPMVDEVMRGWQQRYCTFSDVSICVTTFNVNGKSPPGVLRGWFPDGNLADFYAVGLQEMDLSVGTYIIDNPRKMEEWMQCIMRSLPGGGKNFKVISSMRLIGIFIVLFQTRNSPVKVSKISAAYIATGISMLVNKLGNKGGTAISLRLNDTLVCFVNCHLAAGTGELERRNQDFRIFPSLPSVTVFPYTITTPCSDQIRQIASCSEFPVLLKLDQLKEQQSIGQVFVGFQEPELLPFRPTYKYDAGTSTWDTSEKARVPAWCDRILWWTRDPDTKLKLDCFESIEQISISDHKPVRAKFALRIRSIDQEKADKLYDEAIREADRRANELLPQVSLSITEVDFGEVRFLEPSTRLITVKNTGKSPVRFKFIVRPERGICAKWLQITPPHYVIPIGQSTQISLTVIIDKEISWEAKDTKLQDILVMNLEHGRDYFVPVVATYLPRCFGVSLEHLMNRKAEPEKNLIDFGDGPEDDELCPPNVPREVYKLVCALQKLGTDKLDLNDIVDNSTFIKVRIALENNFPKDLTLLHVPALAFYSALLRLLETLKDPLIPFSIQREVRVASSDAAALWRIVAGLPPANAATLEYLIDYLRGLMHLPAAADQLVAWADVIFHGGALLTTLPHLEPRVVALHNLCAYRRDVATFFPS
ncbi:unnamed protein product [Cylicocyclus nassatus]|uniref:RRM domain-containing protein n=1 Tax=Cylicocyclus nassatus TaxID=53992 RepID=A0AA36GM43_CYLNA|nr:unnamed protein product [Cylicocyclus nassatus]